MSILSHLLRFFTPSLRPRANPVKPSPKTKEAISEATGTRDKQIQQHLLQEPQHAGNGKKKMLQQILEININSIGSLDHCR